MRTIARADGLVCSGGCHGYSRRGAPYPTGCSVGKIAAGCRRRQRLAVPAVEVDRLIDDPAQLLEYLPLVLAVTAAQISPGALPI